MIPSLISFTRPRAFLHRRRGTAGGFTLTEIMVGVAIGMIGTIVMMQVLLVSDTGRRTSTAGGDAQINGNAALHAMLYGIRQSGYGMSSLHLIGCNVTLRAGVQLNVLAPVTINHADIPAGDANTDTLLLAFGNAAGSPEGDLVVLQPALNTYAVTAPASFDTGDWIVAQSQTRPTPCNLIMEQVLMRSVSPPNLTVATGLPAMTNGSIFNLGSSPQLIAYAIRRGNLTACDFMSNDCRDASLTSSDSVWTPLATGIVSLRAQYGRDTSAASMDATVDVFDQITPGSSADVSGFSLQCAVSRVLAARIVLVARSGSLEKTDVTAGAPIWAGSTEAPIDLSGDGDWRRYRYKVFETMAPLRNLVSLGAQTGC